MATRIATRPRRGFTAAQRERIFVAALAVGRLWAALAPSEHRLLCCPAGVPAAAPSPSRSLPSPRLAGRLDRWCRWALGSTLVFNLLDALLTLAIVSAGLAIEANPLMAELLARGPVLFVGAKLALVSAAVVVLWRYWTPRLARLGAGLSFTAYAAIMLVHTQSIAALGAWLR